LPLTLALSLEGKEQLSAPSPREGEGWGEGGDFHWMRKPEGRAVRPCINREEIEDA